MAETVALTKKDFKSDQEVRWCPGCGDYAILNSVQSVVAKLGVAKKDIVFVSGIGCSSRFPYYMDTYGFHSIHGRAPAFATGVKTANPDLSVWVVTGDGDGLSIGGNHTAHLLRRNVDLNVLLFNNQIYGLTKGQYSPTSPVGQKTKTSPMGSVDRPFNPISFALGSGATYVARTIDNHKKHMERVIESAAAHKGTSYIEILQNCVIFNKDFYDDIADKKVRDEKTIDLEAGKPMVFGKELDKGLQIQGWEVTIVDAKDATIWDPTIESAAPGFLMSQLDDNPSMPTPLGVFRSVAAPCFEEAVTAQIKSAQETKGEGTLQDLIYAGDTWTVS